MIRPSETDDWGWDASDRRHLRAWLLRVHRFAERYDQARKTLPPERAVVWADYAEEQDAVEHDS